MSLRNFKYKHTWVLTVRGSPRANCGAVESLGSVFSAAPQQLFFPLCVFFFFFFFHAVFRRREAADFPFNHFSCRSQCQSNSSAATSEKKQGRGEAAAKSPLFWGIDGQESENNWVPLTVVRHWLLMLQFLTRQDAGGAAPMRAAL